MPDKVIVLNEGPPWGFRMTGGKNTGSPLKISRVNNAGKAAKSGVREGFLIETINSATVDHLTSSEAQALIRNSGDTLTIGVYRQPKSNSTGQNDHGRETEAKALADKCGRSKQQTEIAETTTNKKSKRIRKRRRKKKPVESPEQLNDQHQKSLPITIIEQNQQLQSPTTENPKIEIIPANSDLRVDELEWIKRNEALLIAELETRRQAGLPIQVVVRVEKITPSAPEYCQIIPDFCHLDVIKEETSASDEDRKRDTRDFENLPVYRRDGDEEENRELENISEVNHNEATTLECPLERLESPSLVRESSEILRFADIVTTDNDYEINTLEPLKQLLTKNVNNVKNCECTVERDTRNTTVKNFQSETNNINNRTLDDDMENDADKIHETNANQTLNNNNITTDCSRKRDQSLTSTLLDKELCEHRSYEDICYQENPIEVHRKDKQFNESDVLRTKSQFINDSFISTEPKYNTNVNRYNLFSKNEHHVKIISHQDDTAKNDESSDDSTIKLCDTYNHKIHKPRGKIKVSLNDRLKEIARLLQDDTDDYEEIQSTSQTTSRCVSIASDADVDTDWVSFTLSDGESSKSLCLSPSQLRSSYAPSTVSETSEIIDLHKKFLNRTKSPNFSSHHDAKFAAVDILGYDTSLSSSPSKSYTSEVFDEACRMCGTSDEPLSDAECLVSLRKYRETRSRLLDVIQKEQRHDRSVIDRPSASMPTFIDTLSVPDHRTRELMYTEYMEKVKERENRLHNKVIRITKSSRPLSSGSLPSLNDVDAEFLTKARERLEKLGVGADVEIQMKEEYYPRHLVDIVPEEEVCVEEVQMNGVWSPELKHKSLDLENVPRRKHSPSSAAEQLPPVWTPNSSPTPDRKAYKPVRFESPTLSRKKITADAKKVPPKPPNDLPALRSPPPPPPLPSSPSPTSHPLPSATSKTRGDENVHSTDRRLPRVQSPTVTLLQKAREGQLPKGSAYLDPDEYNMDKENKSRRSTSKRNVDTDEIKYASRHEYDSQSDEKKQKKMVEISPKKYEGIGPTTKEGIPIVLRSEIKEPNQPKWYKQMYESLHKFQSDEPKARNGDGYLSEPEKGYESDYGENRLFQNLDSEYTKHGSVRRPISPVKCGQDRYKNQPRPIENYEPGHSSIAEKETKQFWDDVVNAFDENSEQHIPYRQNRSSLKKSNLAQALKESGYDSDSTLVFKRRENQSQCLSPTEQKTAYKVIQNGGEVPFQGLRKTVPDRPKDSPHKYAESEVTLQYRRPVRNEIKEEWSEEHLAVKQAEAMRRIYQEERRRKYLQELQDMSNRRHADNLLPSQKSPIPLNRYDDFPDESGAQPPRSRTPEPKLVARALYNFAGQTSRELSFRKGDIIFVRKQIDKNWYEGEHNAMVGLFPFNYVEVIPYDGVRTTPHRPYEGQARAKFNFVAQTNMELSLVKGELVVLTRRVDGNWYEGRIGSRKGIFPVSYVTVLVEPGDHPNSTAGTPFKPVASPAAHSLITSNPPKTQHMYQPDSYNSSTPTRNSGTQTKKQTNNIGETLHVDVHSEPMPYRALYNYKPQNSDELELREGDVVFVMEKCDDGWYVGSSKRTGCFGTFPGNYVQRSI